MFSNSLYYKLKPFVPRRIQIEVRRQIVLRKRSQVSHVWPIDERAGKPPEGWTGWPDGKKFALVLTHDVETAEGQEKCLGLMEMEKKLGFRSSFNFVVEEYRSFPELRVYLEQQGFEVGIHGLRHNKNLYKSRSEFERSARKINRYIKEWQCVGFRSPSMYHNLDWIGDLDIQYDSSTFDTDPFEPQPDGAGTIFPFWVPSNRGTQHSASVLQLSSTSYTLHPSPSVTKGYVELPYTLPQDFTLFIIMGEANIDIWKKKLDWIAEKGGMALLITHPDYMRFGSENGAVAQYALEFYRELLEYVERNYAGNYWNALPREVASFCRETQLTHLSKVSPRPPSTCPTLNTRHSRPDISATQATRLRICMLTYSFYESDGRVKRYAEALAERGDEVDIIALNTGKLPPFEIMNGVDVHRIQERVPDERSKFSYLEKIIRFLLVSSVCLSRRHLKNRYDLVHVHSIPDFEVFAAFVPKLSGAKIILDIHDIVPELYTSKFSGNDDGVLFKALTKVEKASIGFCDHAIISNHIWEKKILGRSAALGKCCVMLNYPDPGIFFPRPRKRNDGQFIIMYPGTLNWHQGLDIAVKAFAEVKEKAPQAEFHIYGRGSEIGLLSKLVEDLGLKGRVNLKPPLPIEEIAEIMADADLGVIPKRNDAFGGEAFSTKSLEFMSLGVPVLMSATKIDRYYFNDSVVRFFEPDNVEALSAAMLEMIRNRSLRESLAANALKFVEDFSWAKKKQEYLNLVDRLVSSK